MALTQLKSDVTAARLAQVNLPEGAGWITQAREAAMARLRQMGLPSKRDEYWKYTRPDDLVSADAPSASVFDNDESPIFGTIDRLKVVFVDGVFDDRGETCAKSPSCQRRKEHGPHYSRPRPDSQRAPK